MADKNSTWSFILKILIQILNFALSKVSGKKNGGVENHRIDYKQDEQENREIKEKVNKLIKSKLGRNEE